MEFKSEDQILSQRSSTYCRFQKTSESSVLKNKINIIESLGLLSDSSPRSLKLGGFTKNLPTSIKIGDFMSAKASKNIITCAKLANAAELLRFESFKNKLKSTSLPKMESKNYFSSQKNLVNEKSLKKENTLKNTGKVMPEKFRLKRHTIENFAKTHEKIDGIIEYCRSLQGMRSTKENFEEEIVRAKPKKLTLHEKLVLKNNLMII